MWKRINLSVILFSSHTTVHNIFITFSICIEIQIFCNVQIQDFAAFIIHSNVMYKLQGSQIYDKKLAAFSSASLYHMFVGILMVWYTNKLIFHMCMIYFSVRWFVMIIKRAIFMACSFLKRHFCWYIFLIVQAETNRNNLLLSIALVSNLII